MMKFWAGGNIWGFIVTDNNYSMFCSCGLLVLVKCPWTPEIGSGDM